MDAEEIFDILKKEYPSAQCELNFDSVFELLIAVILSAQCTDKRVNKVTQKLFKIASTPQDFIKMGESELSGHIYSCGFYRNKSKNIISACKDIIEKFDSQVPNNFAQLMSLSGVGRKTANVVMAVAYGGNNIAVDTHVFRTSRRLGLSNGKTPFEVEKDLMSILPEKNYSSAHHLLIFHGRYRCKAQNPYCADCLLTKYCQYENKMDKNAKATKELKNL